MHFIYHLFHETPNPSHETVKMGTLCTIMHLSYKHENQDCEYDIRQQHSAWCSRIYQSDIYQQHNASYVTDARHILNKIRISY